MDLLIRCQNEDCGKKMRVNTIHNFTQELTFENLVNVVTCPYCNTKNKVIVQVKKIETEEENS